MTPGFTQPDDFAAAQLGLGWFRPLLALSYMFNQHVGFWIETNVLIHLACCVLVYFIARRLELPAKSAAFFMLLNPLAADALWSVAGRSSMLCSVFMLAAVLAALHERWFTTLPLALLAAGCKEEAIALVPLLAWLHHRQYPRWWLEQVTVAALAITATLLTKLPESNAVSVSLGMRDHMFAFGSAIGHYLLGGHQSVDPANAPGLLPFLACFICVLALIIHDSVPAYLVLLSPLFIYLFAPLPDVLFEHRMYFALAGVALLLAGIPKRLVPVLVGLMLIFSLTRAYVYADPTRLWEEAVEQNPDSVRAHTNLSGAYGASGRLALAEHEARLAHALRPDLEVTRTNLAFILITRGNFSEASKLWQ